MGAPGGLRAAGLGAAGLGAAALPAAALVGFAGGVVREAGAAGAAAGFHGTATSLA